MTTPVLGRRTVWQLVGIWLVLRLASAVWISLLSPVRPFLPREQAIPLWPPTSPLGAWLERVILAPWERRDVNLFLHIVTKGYRLDDGTAQFHPLYPWLATPLAAIMGQPLLALLLVSSLATLGLLIAFEYLARLDLAPPAARTSTLLLILAPPAFILFAPYTESLFLLCSVLCILWAREQRWWLAGLAGALATLTRQQGLFLLLPLAWEMWEVSNRQWRHLLLAWRSWLALALVPAGMLVWIIYRALALGDVQANFSNPQALIYSVLISPSASKVVPEQAFLWPWDVLWVAAQNYQLSPGQNIVDLVLGAGFLVLLVVAWPNMRISYRIYAVVVTLVSFSYYTGPLQPYMGLSRHLLLAFPVFIGLGPVIRPGLTRLLLLTLSSFGFFFLIFVYVIRAWVP